MVVCLLMRFPPEMRTMVLEFGMKMILNIKWQRIWRNYICIPVIF